MVMPAVVVVLMVVAVIIVMVAAVVCGMGMGVAVVMAIVGLMVVRVRVRVAVSVVLMRMDVGIPAIPARCAIKTGTQTRGAQAISIKIFLIISRLSLKHAAPKIKRLMRLWCDLKSPESTEFPPH